MTATTLAEPLTGTRRTKPSWAVGREDLVDGGALVALALVAVAGLTSVYDGPRVLLIGLVGALAGVVAGWLIAVRRLSPLAGIGVVVTAFLVGAGPATPDASIAGVLPGPGTPAALLSGLIQGWADLITTAPPVGYEDGLGVVPYVLGFVSGALGMVLARRTDQPVLPAAPALVALGAGIALGTLEPVGVILQGAGFVLVALTWGAIRGNRDRRSADSEIYWPRIASGAAMLMTVLAVGALVGPSLPGVDGGDRYVVREEVIPPFDPRDYPSPLAGYRAYRSKAAKETTYLQVEDLPEGARVRLATMDTYNGIVWVVSGSSGSGSGRFERVGQRILPVPPGEAVDVGVSVEAYEGVWVPSVGATRSVAFSGPHAETLAEAFRYNRATGTGASPVPLEEGDSFVLDATLVDEPDPEELQDAGADRAAAPAPAQFLEEDAEALQSISDLAFAQAGKGGSPYSQAVKLAEYLRSNGAFSDGGPEAEGAARVPAGHSIARLNQFLTAAEPVGNAEQYAAAMALMAQQLGLPARVVLGFETDQSGDVALTGADMQAWVEVAFEGYGWVPFDPTPDEDKQPKQEEQQRPLEEELAQQEPPPPTYLDPPDTVPELAEPKAKEEVDADAAGAWSIPAPVLFLLKYVAAPVGLVIALLAAVVGLKVLRERRRRTRGSTVERIQGAWAELGDRLWDQGYRPRGTTTRRELAAAAPVEVWDGGRSFADAVDRAMFGPVDPGDDDVSAIWEGAEAQFSQVGSSLSRWQRLRARVSVASLLRSVTGRR
ncbi:MAG: hypothetical protein KDA98_07275 [Acidimicrobiales bacterium]|nr:hypothetical protein [Acidimicrobiales bacterium]